jgi:hypothetical protein
MNAVVAEQIRTAVQARLRELAPVLTELEQLQGVLAVLEDPEACRQLTAAAPGLSALLAEPASAIGTSTADAMPRRAQRRGSRRGSDGRAPQGANKQRILAVIAEHPGTAAPEISRLTGIKRTIVATTISRLKQTGELLAHGDGVRLPGLPG